MAPTSFDRLDGSLNAVSKLNLVVTSENLLVAPSCGMVNSLLKRSLEVRKSLG